MTVYLVRHAHAGSRGGWPGEDSLRPLSGKGAGQAEAIAERLADTQVAAIISSPAVRCTQTVAPLAELLGLEVEPRRQLAEGSDPTKAVKLMLKACDDGLVACAHGDLIPAVIRLLAEDGTRVTGLGQSQKASTWELHSDGRRFTHAVYVPPPGG